MRIEPAWLTSPFACADLVARLVALSALFSASEILAARRFFADDGPLGWSVVSRRLRVRGNTLVARALGYCFREKGFRTLQIVGVIAAASLFLFAGDPNFRPAALAALTLVSLLTHLRNFGFATTGADRLRLAILGALMLRQLAPASHIAAEAALAFIAGQCALAYFVAGISKLDKREWQTGSALAVLLRTSLLGDPRFSAWLDRHRFPCRLLTWSVLVLEVGFPLAIICGTKVGICFVAGALAMQLAIGHLMGLAPFVWAFFAAYPAVLYVGGRLTQYSSR